LDRISAKKPAKLLDSKSLTLGFSRKQIWPVFLPYSWIGRSEALAQECAALLPAVGEFLGAGVEYAWLRSTRTAAGIAAACAGEWSRAEEHHRAAIHHADTAPARIFQPVSREWYAAMLSARGDMDRAHSMLAEAQTLYETIGMPGYARRVSERLAAMAR
jgi:hypothetical protein